MIRKLFTKLGIKYGAPSCVCNGKSWAEVLLEPTRIYVKQLLPLLAHVKAFAHITGGGLLANLARVIPENLTLNLQYKNWPELFNWIKTTGNITEDEMLSTFNCGVGMTIVISEDNLCIVKQILDEEFIMLGQIIEKSDGC